jgi:GT2 family glycosyltransferase
MARAPIVCLIADDIHLEPEALHAHLDDHGQNPEPNVAILGKVVQSPKLTQSVFLKVWDPFRFSEIESKRELSYLFFFACNISCKKEFLLKNGLFSETLVEHGAYAHEDVELGYRLAGKGLRILYNKDALGYHYHVVTLEKATQTAYQKGLKWVLFRKHVDSPELTIRYHVLNRRFLKDYIRAFGKNNGLVGLDANFFLLVISQIARVSLFNSITVPFFWLPVMRLAEKNRLVANQMHRLLYRCTISYHFHKGVARKCKT